MTMMRLDIMQTGLRAGRGAVELSTRCKSRNSRTLSLLDVKTCFGVLQLIHELDQAPSHLRPGADCETWWNSEWMDDYIITRGQFEPSITQAPSQPLLWVWGGILGVLVEKTEWLCRSSNTANPKYLTLSVDIVYADIWCRRVDGLWFLEHEHLNNMDVVRIRMFHYRHLTVAVTLFIDVYLANCIVIFSYQGFYERHR